MGQAPQIQTYIIVSFLIFLAFAGILCYLLVSLLTKQALLKKARTQLQEYSENLERMVEERTAELKASEEMYRDLFESSQEGILVVGQGTGKILKTNAEACALFGHDPEKLLQMHFRDLIDTEISAGGPAGWKEILIRRPDGSGRYIDCILGHITYQSLDCCQVICRDITEKREVEVQLLQSMKMSALGQLAAGVAHELNTPLNTIYSSSYFIKEQTQNQIPKVQKHFELIETEIARCRKIVKDLLSFSRSPAPTIELKKTDLNELLEVCLALMGKEIRVCGIQLIKDLQKLPLVMIDPSRLTQVFSNLILNAVQAMPSGGKLTIRTWADANSDLAQTVTTRVIHVCIEDTGVGIPVERLPTIFTPFYTTKRSSGGVGLGLAVSYEIVKLFNGQIKVESETGRGAKFTVSLPLLR